MLSIANESDLNINNGLYIIKFWSTWCGPCKSYAPVISKLDEEFENITFFSVDVDQVPELAQRFKIKSLPSLILIKDGEEVDRIIGATQITPLRTKFRELENLILNSEKEVQKMAAQS
jgi:thioredoxin 1